MRLQKLALLWMLEEKVGKGKNSVKEKSSQVRKGKFGKLRRSHQGPEEVMKPRSSWRKALLSLRFSRGISHYYVSLAVKYAEINFRFHSLRRFLCCCEVGVLHLSK